MKTFALALLSVLASSNALADMRVGVARIDITPDYPVRLSGFGFRRAESEGVTQRIWAKALAFGESPKTLAVLITVDNLGLPASQIKEVADRLQRTLGLDPNRLAVTASHTHTAPMLRGVAPTLFGMEIPSEHQKRIDKYSRELSTKLVEVASRAIRDRRDADVSWGSGRVAFASNRRTSGGPVDHDLPVLVVRGKNETVRAIFTSYACHCVTLSNNQISGDWAGYAQSHIEKRFPGAVALLSVGCGADQNPSSGVTGARADIASNQGMVIAGEVARLLDTPLTPLDGPLEIRHERILLPLDTPRTRRDWEARAKQKGAVGYHARVNLARLDSGKKLMTDIDYPIQSWAFGKDLGVVFLPGEVVVDYSLRLKKELDSRRLWINAYANHSPCYIPSERILKEGGYEGGGAMIYYDVPTRLAPGLEQKIIDVVKKQLGKTFEPAEDASKTQGSPPRSPRQSASCIRVREGLRVELVASEPLVIDPVAIDFGADGSLWVVEMNDYPLGLDGEYSAGGRVKILYDDDRDGHYDRAVVFLDNLPFPTGAMPWGRGAFVCAAPDILYAEDRDGDGKAEHVEKIFSGFETHNYQARVNSLRYGLDGLIYGAAGLFGGRITTSGGDTVDLRNRDFRFDPASGVIEAVSGTTQHGRVRDDASNWFGCDNGTLIRHYPVDSNYARRNPYIMPPPAAVFVPQGDGGALFPAARQLVLFKLSGPPGRATAACGLEIYRDELLGDGFRGNSFTCEPVNQLVHRRVLSPRGVTFSGKRAAGEKNSEFLTSTDPWFRPVEARTGPDGALWIVDMYRYVIEHPRWIPEETLRTLDVRAGSDKGRIYRVLPRQASAHPVPNLEKATTSDLVHSLTGPNGPLRDLAQQLLIARRPETAVPLLEQLVRDASRPESRLQALATLAGLEAISTPLILTALKDDDAIVRKHAILFAESLYPARDAGNSIVTAVTATFSDPDPQVRLQLAYTLGAWQQAAATRTVAKLLIDAKSDDYIVAAALSSVSAKSIVAVVRASLEAPDPGHLEKRLPDLARLSAHFENGNALRLVISSSFDSNGLDADVRNWQLLAEVFKALSVRGSQPAALLGDTLMNDVVKLHKRARDAVLSPRESTPKRIAAASILGFLEAKRSADLAFLSACLNPVNDIEFQRAAVERLSRMDGDDVSSALLDNWNTSTPQLRTRIIDVLVTRTRWMAFLVRFLEDGGIHLRELSVSSKQQLLKAPDVALRARIERLLATTRTSASSEKTAKLMRAVLKRRGDAERGKSVFLARCATCHQLGPLGQDVGPDLAALTDRTATAILTAVLDPDRNVDGRYLNYTALTRDGRIFSGLLAEESSTAVTLRMASGDERKLLRSNIASLQASRSSFMPTGLADDLTEENLASLLAFLTRNSPIPKTIDGNRPNLVEAHANGSLDLQAASAEIYGNNITFEKPFQNIGFWHNESDKIAWTLRIPMDGRYDVTLEWACPDASAGSRFILEGDIETLRAQVQATGGWDHYRNLLIGNVELLAGTRRIILRPDGPIAHGALMDLRSIHLEPSTK